MERPCSQELPAVQPSYLESGGPREPDLLCRARHHSPQPCPAQALCRASIAQCRLGTCHVTSLAVDIPGTGSRDHPLPPPRWAVKQGLQLSPQTPRSSLIPPGQKLQGDPPCPEPSPSLSKNSLLLTVCSCGTRCGGLNSSFFYILVLFPC